ncbi:MAG: hypothetical protein WCL02_04000 [bacterium]
MSIVRINQKNPILPDNLSADTLYLVEPGTYLSENGGTITMPNCSALIGVSSLPMQSVIIKTKNTTDSTIIFKGDNIIVDNIHIDGEYNDK